LRIWFEKKWSLWACCSISFIFFQVCNILVLKIHILNRSKLFKINDLSLSIFTVRWSNIWSCSWNILYWGRIFILSIDKSLHFFFIIISLCFYLCTFLIVVIIQILKTLISLNYLRLLCLELLYFNLLDNFFLAFIHLYIRIWFFLEVINQIHLTECIWFRFLMIPITWLAFTHLEYFLWGAHW
jgi:hypothetical protein